MEDRFGQLGGRLDTLTDEVDHVKEEPGKQDQDKIIKALEKPPRSRTSTSLKRSRTYEPYEPQFDRLFDAAQQPGQQRSQPQQTTQNDQVQSYRQRLQPDSLHRLNNSCSPDNLNRPISVDYDDALSASETE